MPPKRDSSTSANHNGNSTTTSSSNNETAATSSTTITVATNLQSNSTTSSTNGSNSSTNNNNNTTNTATAVAASAGNSILPVCIADAAAEQRTIAYQANAKLCRLVRKCPWMYDRNHHNYAKKHILDKSWCKIAKECNDSVASCKERWRNIRAAFARSINIYKTHSGPNRVKPYYLHKELSFLVKPMMEGRDKKEDYDDGQDGGGGGVKDEDNGEDDAPEEDEEEDEEPAEEDEDFPDDIKSAFEALNPDIRIQTETRYQKLLRSNNNNNNNNEFESSGIFEPHTEFTTASDAENEFHFSDENLTQAEAERRVQHMLQQHQQQQQQQPLNGLKRPPMHLETEDYDTKRFKLSSSCTAANENDIRFLEALLPDMALMNTRQKIVFKRKIYQTLEEVFENSNDFPNIEHNNNHKMEHNLNNSNLSTMSAQQQGHGYNNTSPLTTPAQVRQTVLTVNSSTARNLINNIANLSEAELQKVNGFLQTSLRNPVRPLNGNNTPSSAAAKLMSSTPKITITKVTCPPPASLRNMALNKPPSPSPATVSTTIHNPSAAVISSNVHSTTSSNPNKSSTTQNGSNASSSSQQNNSPWNQLLPITIKDEIEDVDIV